MQCPSSPSTLEKHHPAHAVGDTPDVLHLIRDPGVNLSLWRRPAQDAIRDELSSLRASQLPDKRYPTSAGTFEQDIVALFRRNDLDPLDFKNFRADLHTVAGRFFDVSHGYDVKFRLLTTDSDDCRRFHVDTRDLRLLCTYQGPGTQWLSDEQVDREALRRGAPNEVIMRFGQPLEIEPFCVGIMRGEPCGEGNGLVHRSPPVAGSGQTRVLFCLDADPGWTGASRALLTPVQRRV